MLLAAAGAALLLVAAEYLRLARRVDAQLRVGPFSHTVDVYAAPERLAPGDAITVEELVARLRLAGYSTSPEDATGWYRVRGPRVEIFPGPRSYFERRQPAAVRIQGGSIARIISLDDGREREEIEIEPLLITNISGEQRERRRPVAFAQIPPVLVEAVTSAEDKNFFRHPGVDVYRILKAAYVDLRQGSRRQGASTLGMQLARGLWLQPDKSFLRKFRELLITLHLETRLSKEQIFETYCNHVYLGRRSTFSINGFGEGARVYFGKDIADLSLTEAATLAGMVQRPSYFNPFRYPGRVRHRRNVVLGLMRENGHLTEEQYREAVGQPLKIAPGGEGPLGLEAQYFIDRVNNRLATRFAERETRAARVYTTLDPRLQRAAVEAIARGMKEVDQRLQWRRRRGEAMGENQPQVALIALDPRTGAVKAMVGGRDYGQSQLDHVMAQRQPGSVFKPFVYAAALSTAVEGGSRIFTPGSTVVDEPTVFHFGGKPYQPDNYGSRFLGRVTLRRALAASANVATVKVAEAVGYEYVVEIARRAGLKGNLQPTPAVALGAYEATPLEIAAAYGVFANGGTYTEPALISMVESPDGVLLYSHVPRQRRAIDPRIAYMMVNMMEDVINRGSGAGVRARGFRLPAAGKTGTSRDGWFAGFTSELLCVVWVGFDDHRDLKLEGSKAALPIWTEFMKRAHEFRPYSEARAFERPEGIGSMRICNASGLLASPYCPSTRVEVFINGSQGLTQCHLHSFASYYAAQQRRRQREAAAWAERAAEEAQASRAEEVQAATEAQAPQAEDVQAAAPDEEPVLESPIPPY